MPLYRNFENILISFYTLTSRFSLSWCFSCQLKYFREYIAVPLL